jgi:uncharacterized protein HemX
VRWTQRRPAHATALALAFALVLGAPTALWLQQRTANARLTEKSEELRAQRDRAKRNLELAGQSIEQLLVRVGDPALADQPGVERLRHQLLEDAMALNSELARIDPLDPGAEARSVRA